ncbi:cobalt-precorrin-5B (C(1))-methyltransferase [Beijerinckia sp. L45]|uniref:cobalt-precorrin-5B (C(1))-methyltransferase n=1 Tax=Beijerinckia sp. L45 TaxID=1641855 RepID=UPI00131D0C8E|nr:cobalt-precorrin-5B (C(1))-methyltransferase [Beijerinckia sp. L45]
MSDASSPETPLRRGWTTGACAAAAAKAACEALLSGQCPSSVAIPLPGGQRPAFAIAHEALDAAFAEAGIIKDAGDDPDVTHGAMVISRVARGPAGSGLTFRAGSGVGMVTRPGLPLPVGEPAINPGPRAMIAAALGEVIDAPRDLVVTISIPGGEKIAERTLNGRLGIVGGLSILGTTGIVIPFSCAAWIDTIHRGVDVARAMGLPHIAGATGTTSEQAVQALYGLPEPALIEMGDFAGGLFKYLRRHPVERVTIAGGFAKMVKLGQGLLDLHSGRGRVDLDWLAARVAEVGGSGALVAGIAGANTAAEVLARAEAEGLDVTGRVAETAWATAANALAGSGVSLDIAIFDRLGRPLATTTTRPVISSRGR